MSELLIRMLKGEVYFALLLLILGPMRLLVKKRDIELDKIYRDICACLLILFLATVYALYQQ